ncbi:hypothetical protein JYU04_04030, partial [Dehalococcoides mccartyi]|nr:hypothetical protein [Dehalococcoides mccartyi]
GAEIDENQNPVGGAVTFNVVVLAVGHAEFVQSSKAITDLVAHDGVLVDLTGKFSSDQILRPDITYWGF